MGEPSPYPYTYRDIERYHSGQMTPEEMHRMEMAALNDPFLADALEGYTHTSTATSDLEKLIRRLDERTTRKASVLWINKNYNALKVAAVLLFVIAGSWLLFVSKQKPASDLALEQRIKSGNNELSKTKQDSTRVYKTDDSNKQVNANAPSTAFAPVPKKKIKQQLKVASDKDVAIGTSKKKPEITQTPISTPVKEEASTVQIAPAARLGNARAFRTESKSEKDSTDKLSGYAFNTKKERTDTLKNVDVVLKPQAVPNLSEVVVTKARTNRKLSRSAFAVKDTLEPEEGWDEYNDYIANNIKSPEEAKAKSLTGEVELSFDVNHDGRPVHIRVEKSLCDPCDTEAIRLLKEGPKWKKKKNKKGKLRIHF